MATSKQILMRVLVGCAALAIPAGMIGAMDRHKGMTEPNIVTAVANYTTWAKITPAPFRVSAVISAMCAAPPAGRVDPHSNAYINVFVNQTGRTAMVGRKGEAFPAGSVIVKEKLTDSQGTSPELLTVMIKRSPGYNPAVGDWEFAVVDGKATSVQAEGKLANCAQCHKSASGSDYVFRSYLTQK